MIALGESVWGSPNCAALQGSKLWLEEEQQNLEGAEQTMATSNKRLAELSDELCVLKEELSQLQRREG